jgi:autotransporter-associated beta strand protein
LLRLEDRLTPSVTWTALTTYPSGNPGTMLLMPNGQDLMPVGGSGDWNLLTPDSQGNYVGGTFGSAASTVAYPKFVSSVLPTDQVFVIGGPNDGLYNLKSDTWSPAAAHPGTLYDAFAPSGTYNDAPIALLPPDTPAPGHSPVHPEGSILAGGTTNFTSIAGLPGDPPTVYTVNSSESWLYDIATNQWAPTGDKLHSDGWLEEGLVTLSDNSVLGFDVTGSGFAAQRYVQVGDPLPGSGTSTGQWVDASTVDSTLNSSVNYLVDSSSGEPNDGPTMVRLPAALTYNSQTIPAGSIFAIGSNGKTAFYVPPSSAHATDDFWTKGPDLPTVTETVGGVPNQTVQLVADEASAAVLPNGKIVVVLGDGTTSFLFEFDPANASNSARWTNLNTGFVSQTNDTSFFAYPEGGFRLLVNSNGHLLVSSGTSQMYDFVETGTPSTASQPTISSFSTSTSNGTFTLTGSNLTGLDEGSSSLDEGEMSTNYPIVSLTIGSGGSMKVYYARTSNWTPGVGEGSSTVQVDLPHTLPAGTYTLNVIANGIASNGYTFSWGGPIYVDTSFTTANYPTGSIGDADPVATGSQAATIGVNAFDSVNAGIAAAVTAGSWVIVNGSDGVTTGSGVFSENVAINSPTLVYLQYGPVEFDSLTGNDSGAMLELHGVDLTTDGDSSNDAFDGVLLGTGGLDKTGTHILPLAGDGSGYTGTVTISGGKIQLNNGNALVNSTVDIEANHGLDPNNLTAVTVGALEGTQDLSLSNTNLTVGGNGATTAYSGDLAGGTLGGSIDKIGGGTWTLSGDNRSYTATAGVTVDGGHIELGSQYALGASTVTLNVPGYGLTTTTGLSATTLGGLAGAGNVNMGSTAFTLGVNNANTTFSGYFAGSGTLDKKGTGTLTMDGPAGSASGGTTVDDGILDLPSGDGPLDGSVITINVLGTLEFSGDAYTSKTYDVDSGTISPDTGVTVTFYYVVTGSGTGLGHGWLDGDGTVISSGATFTHMSSTESVSIVSSSASDQFVDFDNSSYFTVGTGVVNTTSTANLHGFTNEGAGTVEISQDSEINVDGFTSYGVVSLDPGTFNGTSGGFTQVTNVGSTGLVFGYGSRTYISTVAAAADESADIDLNGHNAAVDAGLFVNNGFVWDSTATNHRVVVDGALGTALAKGAGFYETLPQTINGGNYSPGNCPGAAWVTRFAFGPDDVSGYVFYINNATGTAGPTPDSAGQVSGWGEVTARDFEFGADSENPLVVNLTTLVNPSTPGNDVAGAAANFDPTQTYSWAVVKWTGTYTGPTDDAFLNAATVFNTSAFANSFNGAFAWHLDVSSGTLYLTYTPN